MAQARAESCSVWSHKCLASRTKWDHSFLLVSVVTPFSASPIWEPGEEDRLCNQVNVGLNPNYTVESSESYFSFVKWMYPTIRGSLGWLNEACGKVSEHSARHIVVQCMLSIRVCVSTSLIQHQLKKCI